ncbi:MAG: hypothetical protein MUC84_11320, partial [Solirubrobacteraceae bacterium]|nr:hypothetical protein [Solirubrobacteraceae bacterium]
MAKQTKPPAPPPEPEIAPVARSEWLVVGALYLLAVLVYVLLARDQPVPLVTPDEYTYGGAARSLAGGDGLTILGEPVDLRAALYVYLIAPAWWLGSATGAYDLAKAIGVAAVCLTLVPVWWLTRQYAGRWVALVPAVLIVAGTWMTSAASLLTENVALPLEVGVLFAVILAALLLDAFLLRSAEERRARLRAQRAPLIALGALLVLGAVVTLAAGQSTLGFYDTVKDFSPSLADVAEQIGRQWLALTVMTAIVPMALAVAAAATPAAWRDEDRLRPLLAVG